MKDNTEQYARTSKGVTLDRILLCLILALQIVILAVPGRPPMQASSPKGSNPESDFSSGAAGKEPDRDSPLPEAAVSESRQHPLAPPDFFAVRNRMDDLLRQAMAEFEQMAPIINFDEGWSSLMLTPAMDMRDETDENEYVVVFSLPGIDASGIRVSLDGRLLTVSCSSRGGTSHASGFGEFVRSVWLPGPVGDRELARAVVTNDVLRIVIPKGEEAGMAIRNTMIY